MHTRVLISRTKKTLINKLFGLDTDSASHNPTFAVAELPIEILAFFLSVCHVMHHIEIGRTGVVLLHCTPCNNDSRAAVAGTILVPAKNLLPT